MSALARSQKKIKIYVKFRSRRVYIIFRVNNKLSSIYKLINRTPGANFPYADVAHTARNIF